MEFCVSGAPGKSMLTFPSSLNYWGKWMGASWAEQTSEYIISMKRLYPRTRFCIMVVIALLWEISTLAHADFVASAVTSF